ncbi:MAG: tyrosine protein phosphatase [Acidobacteria bacterium]|nr:tyrosine protein phosphatase [Acidobacteriota bacterium]
MKTTVYWLTADTTSRTGIMPRPRGGDWLEDEVRSLRDSHIDIVVSLLEKSEIEELCLQDEAGICEKYGITYLNYPIADRGVPKSEADALNFVRRLVGLLAEGKNLAIHCRQGVGRSSIIAALVKILQGDLAETVFEEIGAARGCSVPDTPEQRDWLMKLVTKIK